MSESKASPFYVVTPFKLGGVIVKPSNEPVDIPADLVTELRILGVISPDPVSTAAGPVDARGDRQGDEARQVLDSIELQIAGAVGRFEAAEAAAIAAETRRDLAIAEADAAEARRDAAIAAAEKAESPITVLYEAGSKGGALLGSDAFPAQVRIGDADVALGELVVAAYARSGLTDPSLWNALTRQARDTAIQAEIDYRNAPPAKQDKPKSDKPKR